MFAIPLTNFCECVNIQAYNLFVFLTNLENRWITWGYFVSQKNSGLTKFFVYQNSVDFLKVKSEETFFFSFLTNLHKGE